MAWETGSVIEAIWTKQSGFNDVPDRVIPVRILQFYYGTYEPGYKVRGDHTGMLAIVADDNGKLHVAEMHHLTVSPTMEMLKQENKRLESERSDQWRQRREAEASRDLEKALADSFRRERDAALAAMENKS